MFKDMAKGDWWFKFEWKDWRGDPALNRCSLETQGFWIKCLCAMYESQSATLHGNHTELSRLIGCFPEEFMRCALELKRTETADVTIGNGDVTLLSRRLQRELSSKEHTKLRVRNHRSNADVTPDVTPVKRDRVRVKSKEIEEREEEKEKEAVAEAAPPTHTEARFGDSHFDNPPVALFEELFHFKTGSNFAKEIFRRVKNFPVWDKLLRDKITYADKSLDERKKLTNWILTEYDKRIGELKNAKPNQSYQDRRAELAQQSYEREAAIRERVRERDRAVLGKALPDSRGQLQLVESNANGQREGGENGSMGTGTDGRDTGG